MAIDVPLEVELVRDDQLEVDTALLKCLRDVFDADVGVSNDPRAFLLALPMG